MLNEAYLEKDVLQHSYNASKKRKKAPTKKLVICQVFDCENNIENQRRCSKKGCIANEKFMCSLHGPRHELHENCNEWKNNSESATNKSKPGGQNKKSSSLGKIQPPQIDPLSIHQYVHEQIRCAMEANQMLQLQPLSVSSSELNQPSSLATMPPPQSVLTISKNGRKRKRNVLYDTSSLS